MGVCTKGLKPWLTHGPSFLGKVLGHLMTSVTLCHQKEGLGQAHVPHVPSCEVQTQAPVRVCSVPVPKGPQH